MLGVENLKAIRHKKLGEGTYRLGIVYAPDTIKNELKGRVVNDIFSYVPELSWFD